MEDEDEFALEFVPKSKRKVQPSSESETEENEAEIKKRKKESNKKAKQIANQVEEENIDDLEPFQEPDAPETNDTLVDQDIEYKLWVDREISRIRQEVIEVAQYALDEANTRKLKQMKDAELEALKRENKPQKGHMKYMQKYYHAGAYSNDDTEEAKQVLSRDFTAPVGGDLLDKTVLPESMRVRGDDYQKKGKTKWTHLSNEDTTTPEYRRLMKDFNKI